MLRVERAARQAAEAQLAEWDTALAHQIGEVAALRLEIERLRLLLAKARRAQFGRSSERGAKLVEQLELQLAELEESAAEEEATAELAASKRTPPPRVGRRSDAAGAGGSCPRLFGRAPARRRHHRAGARQGTDQDRARVGLCSGRPAVRRARPTGGRLLLLARPPWRASRAAPGRVRRHPAGGRLRRVRPALRPEARAGTDPRGGVLGACASQTVRDRRGLE